MLINFGWVERGVSSSMVPPIDFTLMMTFPSIRIYAGAFFAWENLQGTSSRCKLLEYFHHGFIESLQVLCSFAFLACVEIFEAIGLTFQGIFSQW